MEDSPEFKWAAKVVIRRQLRDLIQQLQEFGDEVAVMLVNTSEDNYTHFGTNNGEWFISEQRNLSANFLSFCKDKEKKKKAKSAWNQDINRETNMSPDKQESSRRLSLNKSPRTPKQTSSPGIAGVLEVNIPTGMTEDVSNEDVTSLVGRLVAYVVTNTGQNIGPPQIVSRRGRLIKAKVVLDGLILKKPESHATQNDDGEQLLDKLENIDDEKLKRVQVKLGEGGFMDVADKYFTKSESLQLLATTLHKELETIGNQLLPHKNNLKVIVTKSHAEDDRVEVKMIKANKTPESSDHGADTDVDDNSAVENDTNDNYIDAMDDFEVENGVDVSGDDSDRDPDWVETKHDKIDSDTEDVEGEIKQKVHCSKPPTLAEKMEKHLLRKGKQKRQKRHHSETTKVDCPHCGTQITGVSNLKAHIRYMHMKMRDAKCKVCQREFCNQGKVNVHMFDVHTRQCPACKEYVVESQPWEEGMNNRSLRWVMCDCGENVPVCTVNGRRVDENNRETKKKKKEEESGTRYSCAVCGKIFMRKKSCLAHAKSHNKDSKEHVCEVCGLSFQYPNSLTKHKQKEHGLAMNVCDVCGNKYATEASLRSHMVKAHNDVQLDTNYDMDQDLNQAKLAINTKHALELGAVIEVTDVNQIVMLNEMMQGEQGD